MRGSGSLQTLPALGRVHLATSGEIGAPNPVSWECIWVIAQRVLCATQRRTVILRRLRIVELTLEWQDEDRTLRIGLRRGLLLSCMGARMRRTTQASFALSGTSAQRFRELCFPTHPGRRVATADRGRTSTMYRPGKSEHARALIEKGEARQYVAGPLNLGRTTLYRALPCAE